MCFVLSFQLSKQVRMCSCIKQIQHQTTIIYSVKEKPIGMDMTSYRYGRSQCPASCVHFCQIIIEILTFDGITCFNLYNGLIQFVYPLVGTKSNDSLYQFLDYQFFFVIIQSYRCHISFLFDCNITKKISIVIIFLFRHSRPKRQGCLSASSFGLLRAL